MANNHSIVEFCRWSCSVQVLQAVTIPHADLAARVSKLSAAEVTDAQPRKHSERRRSTVKESGKVVEPEKKTSEHLEEEGDEEEDDDDDDAAADDEDDEEDEEEEEDDNEIGDDKPVEQTAPDPSGNGSVLASSHAGEEKASKGAKKACRFASPSTMEHHVDGPPDETKKFKRPKGSLFINSSDVFDFHGAELTEEDAAAFADIGEGEECSADPDSIVTSPSLEKCAFPIQFGVFLRFKF
jgi:hypothetical protein